MLDAQFRTFAAFARSLSFTEAAEELRITQPVASRHMKDLASRLGVELVQRIGRRNLLTPAGEYLANYVLRAESILAETVRGIQAFAPGAVDTVSLVSSWTPGTYLLPAVIAKFTARHPNTFIEMNTMTSDEAADAVRAHRASFGIVGAYHSIPGFRTEVLRHDELVVIGPRWMHETTLGSAQLEETTWVRREDGTASRDAEESLWRINGISPKHSIELHSREGVKLAVASGAGIAACSRLAIAVELKAEVLGIVNVPTWPRPRDIYLIAPRDLPLSPTAEKFLDFIRAETPDDVADEAIPVS